MGWTSLFGGGDDDWGSNWNLFGGGNFGGSDGNWGSGFDWGSVWGDLGQSGADWWDLIGDGGDSGSNGGGSNWLGTIGNLLGGGGNNSGGGNIWGSLLSGLGGAAQAFMDEESIKEAGKQQRQTRKFEAELLDFYKQKDKHRKRVALDSYGQFSLMNRWAPNYAGDKPVEVPNMPSA